MVSAFIVPIIQVALPLNLYIKSKILEQYFGEGHFQKSYIPSIQTVLAIISANVCKWLHNTHTELICMLYLRIMFNSFNGDAFKALTKNSYVHIGLLGDHDIIATSIAILFLLLLLFS